MTLVKRIPFKSLVIGGGVGLVLSITPMIFLAPLSLAFIVGFIIRMVTTTFAKGSMEAGFAILLIVISANLPVKYEDRKVGPMGYPEMTLYELSGRMRRDWNIQLFVDGSEALEKRIVFSTSQPMRQYDIVEKLAAEAGYTAVDYARCGNGETILFGNDRMIAKLTLPSSATPAVP